MKKIEIIPFHSAGKFKLNEKRNVLISQIDDLKLKNSNEEIQGNNKYIIDDYVEALAYYNASNEKLFYMLFVPLPTYELVFQKQSLFILNSGELFNFLKRLDKNIHIENYVGFGSLKYGIDVYAPNFTEDPSSLIEGISFAIKGYFDTIYSGRKLDINELQNGKLG